MEELVNEYRLLLVEDESLAGLDRAMTLVEKILSVHFVCEAGAPELRGMAGEGNAVDKLSESLILQYQSADLQAVRSVCHRRRNRAETRETQVRVLRAAQILGILPPLVEHAEAEVPLAREALFRDICLLVFHHAYFALLPVLHGRGWETERQLLLASFRRFGDQVPRIADRYSALALYYDALGEEERAARYYREALRATHSDDHEFMTSVQTSWTFLVEHERLGDALDLLLDTYPRVARQDLGEIHELIAATFQLQKSYYEARLGAASEVLRHATGGRSATTAD
jgi:tetratricopeptide (TPR) repeat protein